MIGESGRSTFAGLWDEGELRPRLLEFARIYMANRLRPDMIAIERALIAEGDRSDLGERLRRQFIEPYWRRLAAVFNHEMRAARLRRGDPMVATWQFRGLIEAALVERRLHGDTTITDQAMSASWRASRLSCEPTRPEADLSTAWTSN
jgi:hypothetical protein